MSQLYTTIFHIYDLKILYIQPFCECLGSGLSNLDKHWKIYLWKIKAASEKKCKSMIISIIPAHFQRKKNTVRILIPQATWVLSNPPAHQLSTPNQPATDHLTTKPASYQPRTNRPNDQQPYRQDYF